MTQKTPDYDIIVVGGGIHGVGVAQAAGAAGYRTLVLEAQQLAAGTSSRSSKLIHGGLRYLETLQLGLVRESLRERQILLTVAPDLVRLVPFFVPVYGDTSRPRWKIRVGLTLYCLLGGFAAHTRFQDLRRAEWPLSDGLDTAELRAVFRYWDAQTDDRLLTEAVMDSARSLGAELLAPARFLGATRQEHGYRVRVEGAGGEQELRCRALVNASGPWILEVLEAIQPQGPAQRIDLVQGAHVVLEGQMHEGIYYTEAPSDRRAVFVMPWQGNTLVGTTETPFTGDPGTVAATPAEIQYLLETFRHYFPERPAEVLGTFAGLRVLPGGDGKLSRRRRDTSLIPDTPRVPRLVTIAGGKLTGYRATALKVLRLLRGALPKPRPIADTAELALTGRRETIAPSPTRR